MEIHEHENSPKSRTGLRMASALLLSVVLLAASGCATKSAGAAQETGYFEDRASASVSASAPASAPAAQALRAPMMKAERSAAVDESALPAPGEDAQENTESEAASAARKRVYSGTSRLRTENIEEKKTEIIRLAEENGGYLESVYALQIAIRVPAEKFRDLFTRILSLGEVLYKSVETWDVTEAYADLDSRLSVARQSRDRLAVLLEKTDDIKERIRILKEIRRLDEQIEQLQSTLSLLENQIAFSRISIELVPRAADTVYHERSIPFSWIASLNPLSGSITAFRGKAAFEPGEAFAVFEKESFYRAETPDGVRIRIGSTENSPEGSPDFWRKALLYHLKPYYRTAEPLEYGKVLGVRFTSKDTEPFTYFVGVLTAGKTLYVTEVFYPDTGAKDRHETAVAEALGSLEIHP